MLPLGHSQLAGLCIALALGLHKEATAGWPPGLTRKWHGQAVLGKAPLFYCDWPLGLTGGPGRPRSSLAGSLCLVPLHIRWLHLALAMLAESAGCGLGGQWEGSPHGVAGTALALADPAAPALLVVG